MSCTTSIQREALEPTLTNTLKNTLSLEPHYPRFLRLFLGDLE